MALQEEPCDLSRKSLMLASREHAIKVITRWRPSSLKWHDVSNVPKIFVPSSGNKSLT